MLFSRTDICCRLNKPAYNINFADCLFCCSNHIFTKFIFCLVNTGCINKYNLSSFICMDCLYSVSCRLRLIRRNGNFLTYHTVHKCWLTYIRSSYQRNKPWLYIFSVSSRTACNSACSKHFIQIHTFLHSKKSFFFTVILYCWYK